MTTTNSAEALPEDYWMPAMPMSALLVGPQLGSLSLYYSKDNMRDYARECILADRAARLAPAVEASESALEAARKSDARYSEGCRRSVVKIKKLETREVVHINDPLEDGVLYVSRRFELAIHLCACGCREKTVTPLDDGTSGWKLTEEPNGVTLRPSIGNQNFKCGSHYWITNGEVQPC